MSAEAWRDDAACKGKPVDWWFPGHGRPATRARLICGGCPVRQACLDFALDEHIVPGIYGGLDIRQRYEYRRTNRPDRTSVSSHLSPRPVGAPSRDAFPPGVASRRPEPTPSGSVGRGAGSAARLPAPHDQGVA